MKSATVKFMGPKGGEGGKISVDLRAEEDRGGSLDGKEEEENEAQVLEPHRTQQYVSAGVGVGVGLGG